MDLRLGSYKKKFLNHLAFRRQDSKRTLWALILRVLTIYETCVLQKTKKDHFSFFFNMAVIWNVN